jgi:hypothetical protein
VPRSDAKAAVQRHGRLAAARQGALAPALAQRQRYVQLWVEVVRLEVGQLGPAGAGVEQEITIAVSRGPPEGLASQSWWVSINTEGDSAASFGHSSARAVSSSFSARTVNVWVHTSTLILGLALRL